MTRNRFKAHVQVPLNARQDFELHPDLLLHDLVGLNVNDSVSVTIPDDEEEDEPKE